MYFSDKYRYYKITNVSIFVLGVYTCGISALIWWMYKGITDNGASSSEDKKGMYVRVLIHVYVQHNYVCMYIRM